VLIRLGGFFFVIALVFWLWALFDTITADRERVRNLPKVGWVLVVLLGFEIGAAAWLFLGRPKGQPFPGRPGALGPRPGGGGSGPVGPDDDPDFLKGL
jgi:hypothetical protein